MLGITSAMFVVPSALVVPRFRGICSKRLAAKAFAVFLPVARPRCQARILLTAASLTLNMFGFKCRSRMLYISQTQTRSDKDGRI